MRAQSGTKTAASDAPGAWVDAGNGARRRILAHTPEMMMVEVEFGEGGCGPEHSHPHLQATYVRSGRFDFTVEGATRRLSPGDALLIPSNARHGCAVVEAGTLIDVFTPAREDFLTD